MPRSTSEPSRSCPALPGFTHRHHALVFAFTARALFSHVEKETAEAILQRAVISYGNERGRRMAARARRNGHPLTMANYLAYGEWALPRGEMQYRFLAKTPHARIAITQCPWHRIWQEEGLAGFGPYFCREIDRALVQGFNPDLRLEIRSVLTLGGNCCDFVFRNAGLGLAGLLALMWKKHVRPGKSARLGWDYHTAHLYRSLSDAVVRGAGPKAGQILETVRNDMGAAFSRDHVRALDRMKQMNFSGLPEPWPTEHWPNE